MTEKREYQDKLPEGSISERSPAIAWLDNFWYHYKWPVIIVTFFALVIAVCTAQMLSRESFDTTLVYAGPYRMNKEERADFERLMDSLCPVDSDGDGQKNVQYISYQIYSDEEVSAEKEKAEAESLQYIFNAQYNSNEQKNFNNDVLLGECSVYMVSPSIYQMLVTEKRLAHLSVAYGDDIPEIADEQGYGVRLGDTELYKYDAAVQALSPDTVICIPTSGAYGPRSDAERYADSIEFFRAIADFGIED